MAKRYTRRPILSQGAALLSVLLAGCGESSDPVADMPRTPKEAATQLEEVFDAETSAGALGLPQTVATASAAMRAGDFEKAVVALHAARSAPGVSLNQGIAIHHSMVLLEQELMSAAANGDPKAQRAYDLLKRSKKN